MGPERSTSADALPSAAAEPGAPRRTASLRAIVLGLLMSAVIVGMTQALSIQNSAAEVGGGAPAPAPTYLLFLWVAGLAPLIARWPGTAPLTRGELLLIYSMTLIAGAITHPYALGFLIPHAAAPLYFGNRESGWDLFQPFLKRWMIPGTHAAAVDFFQGGDGSVPWAAWITPGLAWSALLIVLFHLMLCVNVLMRRQWIDNERLTFPLAAVPLALTERGARGRAPILRQPIFWLGVLIPLLVEFPTMAHKYVPQFPDLRLSDVTLVEGQTLPQPWSGLEHVQADVIPWLIGIAYLLPKEITFSSWLFYFVRLLENVFAVYRGTTGSPPSVYTNEFPALFAQGAGAAFALTALALWSARRHLVRALRRALLGPGDRRSEGDADELLSYRAAYLGVLFGSLFLVVWFWAAGMRLWVAALFFGLLMSYFLIFARIRAETGLGMGVILWPKMLDEVMITLLGARGMPMSELTALYSLRWLYFGNATGSVMACQLEGFKLMDVAGARTTAAARRAGWGLTLAAVVVTPLALAWLLKSYYARGFIPLPIGMRSVSMVGSQIYWSYADLVETHNNAIGPEWSGIIAIAAGAVVTVLLSALRGRFLWFPLHPVGYLAANSWGMHINWLSFFTGWLLNVAITRYGGLKLYRALVPLFVGMIVGDMVHQGLWGAVAWMSGTRME
jgi:hypothetical protein